MDKVLSTHLMDCHPKHKGQAVDLAHAHIPKWLLFKNSKKVAGVLC